MSRISGVAVVACLAFASSARADRPVLAMHQVHLAPGSVPSVVNSHVLFLNRCKNGCKVSIGSSDSRTDHSDIGQGMLTPYAGGDTAWNAVVACVKQTMSQFNITVTDVDPGTADHFEVMVAGSACQIISGSSCQYIGGIADFACQAPGACQQYIPDALSFDFSDTWGGSVNDDCSTIAQEIAHTWSLDHVAIASDPMTYYPYSGMRHYQDGVPCGSDCSSANGTSPFGLQCTNNQHICMSSGTSTQDDVKTIMKLFGPAGAQAPTLKITSPADGAAVQPGFEVDADCTSGDGIQEVDLSIDGVPKLTLTAAPFKFMTPANITDGTHKVDILCATNKQATSTAEINVIVGQKCSKDSDCPMNDVCFASACIAGMGASGGLGTACTGNGDCASGECASDGTNQVCVVPCDLSNDQCPGGFGCEQAGTGGVCWPGAAHGGSGGGCDAGGSPGGALALGLGVVALLVMRRKKAGEV